MKKFRGFFITALILLAGVGYWAFQIPGNMSAASAIFSDIDLKNLDQKQIHTIKSEVENMPSVWPFSEIKYVIEEATIMQAKIEELKAIPDPLNNIDRILREFFVLNERGLEVIHRVQRTLNIIPVAFLPEKNAELVLMAQSKINEVEVLLEEAQQFKITLDNFYKNEARMVVLLQNQNEPRSTGGFMGSMVIMDFKKDETLTWKFQDIYELDRKIPSSAKPSAPWWFHDLSTEISLRDANMWPDFPTSAEKIRGFFVAGGEKAPDVVVGTNLNFLREILTLTGPVKLDKWDLELTPFNADMVLQFLVEGKIMGRFNVKDPLLMAAEKIFSAENLKRVNGKALQAFDYEDFIARGNVLAYSSNENLQRLFDEWGMSGRIVQESDADNFLQFDFVSIGANKSEKFLWTRVAHDSLIGADGSVENTLRIVRNHTLTPNLIQEILGTNSWSENVRSLLNDDLLWKLGAGQNRTMIRVMVPAGTELISQNSPSGKIEKKSAENFDVFEIPAYVVPGERLDIELKYKTQIERGSQNWRPYNLQLATSPGKNNAQILTSISTKDGGKFSAETFNIGRPVDLVRQNFRSVVEFGE